MVGITRSKVIYFSIQYVAEKAMGHHHHVREDFLQSTNTTLRNRNPNAANDTLKDFVQDVKRLSHEKLTKQKHTRATSAACFFCHHQCLPNKHTHRHTNTHTHIYIYASPPPKTYLFVWTHAVEISGLQT